MLSWLWFILLGVAADAVIFSVFLFKQNPGRWRSRLNIAHLIYTCIFFVASVVIFCIKLRNGEDTVLCYISFIAIIVLTLGNLFIYHILRTVTEAQKYYKFLEEKTFRQETEIARLNIENDLNTSRNEIVHNLSHSLKTIGLLALEGDCNEISRIVEEMDRSLNRESVTEICENKMINLILSDATNKAKKNNLKIEITVEKNCSMKSVKDIDISIVLGNLLNNAFEAAEKKGTGSQIGLRARVDKKTDTCVICIINEFSGDLNIKNGKLRTTKHDELFHGIGLSSVSKIVRNYGGLLECTAENGLFIAMVVLPNS